MVTKMQKPIVDILKEKNNRRLPVQKIIKSKKEKKKGIIKQSENN